MSMDGDVVSIDGTGRGCDTTIVVEPAHLNDMFDLYVKEIIYKPTVKRR
jgi:hypothetical protein